MDFDSTTKGQNSKHLDMFYVSPTFESWLHLADVSFNFIFKMDTTMIGRRLSLRTWQ
jgi:hypothetical protein